jgi:ectoine hydroxylase-related dioxygenase (phytanoyl-CoA dioxygenase family)
MFRQGAQKLSSFPIVVRVSASEALKGKLSWQNLELATRAIHRDGLVVLKDAITDHSKLDILNQKMIADAKQLQSRGEDSPYNYNKGNIQQDPPMMSQYFHSSIFLNPLATQVTSSVLGPRPRWTFCSGNTAMPPTPGEEPLAQPTHSDADFEHPHCPFALVVNVPLIDMDVQNGSTDIWLGTQHSDLSMQEGRHGERASGRIKKELLEERSKIRPSSQPDISKGSIVIRDLRLWHGGMPNLSQQSRVMLAFIHYAAWFRNAMRIELSDQLMNVVQEAGKDLQVQADFIPEPELEKRYLNRPFGNAYKFDQEDPIPNPP